MGDAGHHAHGDAHASGGGASAVTQRILLWSIALNAGYVVLEAGFGFATGSLGLIADAGHNLSDVLALGAAWVAIALASKPPGGAFTYGFKRTPILASLFNALLLLVAMGAVVYEAIRRFLDPAPLDAGVVMIVAAVGVLVNGGTTLLLARSRRDDLNLRGAFLHMAADTAVTAGVILAAAGIAWTGWLWLDPLASIVIAGVVLIGTWNLLDDAVRMSLDAAPADVDLAEIRGLLAVEEGVRDVHDLHVWPLSTTEIALTAHLVLDHAPAEPNALLARICRQLGERFEIDHATLQLEFGEPADPCGLSSPETV